MVSIKKKSAAEDCALLDSIEPHQKESSVLSGFSGG